MNYLGFPFWDVLTFPMANSHAMGEINEILVDRISQEVKHYRFFFLKNLVVQSAASRGKATVLQLHEETASVRIEADFFKKYTF